MSCSADDSLIDRPLFVAGKAHPGEREQRAQRDSHRCLTVGHLEHHLVEQPRHRTVATDRLPGKARAALARSTTVRSGTSSICW